MALTKINYNDKDNYQSSALANEYKVTASDMNEIKTVVNAICDQVDNESTYSTTETAIGTWINGDTIYRKVVYVSSLPNATTGTYSVGATISQVVDLRGWANNGLSLTSYRPDSPTGSIGMWYDFGEQKIKIATALDRSSSSAYVIIEYTKS